jgi:hypothetical protein
LPDDAMAVRSVRTTGTREYSCLRDNPPPRESHSPLHPGCKNCRSSVLLACVGHNLAPANLSVIDPEVITTLRIRAYPSLVSDWCSVSPVIGERDQYSLFATTTSRKSRRHHNSTSRPHTGCSNSIPMLIWTKPSLTLVIGPVRAVTASRGIPTPPQPLCEGVAAFLDKDSLAQAVD